MTAELDDDAEHRITAEHVAHPLEVERLEIESCGCVEIGADRLRIAIDEHAVDASRLQRRRRMNAAVVELDALADPNRPRTDYRNGGVAAADDLILIFVGCVVIGRDRCELGGARINLAEGRLDRQQRQAAAA